MSTISFYRLRLPLALAKWFGLPKVRRTSLEERYGKAGFAHIPDQQQYLYPHFLVLPMGFSLAPYLAQECLRSCISAALGPTNFLSDTAPAPDVVTATACVAYVDNGVHVCRSRDAVARGKQTVTSYVIKNGLATHDEVDGGSYEVALVFFIDGEKLEIRPKPERMEKNSKALL